MKDWIEIDDTNWEDIMNKITKRREKELGVSYIKPSSSTKSKNKLNRYLKNKEEEAQSENKRNTQNNSIRKDLYGGSLGEDLEETSPYTDIKSNGIYSLNTGWVKHPVQQDIPDVDMEEFEKEFKIWEDRYFDLLDKEKSTEEIDNLIEDVYNLRKEGMEENGEYSIKNLIFKEFRNLGYLDNLKELRKKEISKELSLEQLQEHILLESKQDIDAFINKFGQDTYDEFKKSTQRLKNNNYSTDIIKYTKDDNWTKEKLDKLLFNLSNKLTVSKDDATKIEGKHRDLGIQGDYHIYEPLDVLASMNLGVGSGWCTAGRYGHYGDKNFKPSLKAAEKHWKEYTKQGVRFFYYLDKNTNLAKYAIAVYPRLLDVNRLIGENYVSKTNFEIYNAEDLLDYNAFDKLPTNNLGIELILEVKLTIQDNIIYTIENNIKTKFAEIKDDTLYIKDGVEKTMSLNNILSTNSLNKIKNIVIPNSVEKIEDNAFAYYISLKSITIPNSVKEIGRSSFAYCESLKSIILPNSVEKIGAFAFENCTSLKWLNIPNSVKEIGYAAFHNCPSLESINIPNSVKQIVNSAFSECTSLKSIVIPDGVEEIGDGAFASCAALKSIILPKGVEKIGHGAFAYCRSLESITIPNSVEEIGTFAFRYCILLKSIVIPNSVEKIEYGAFANCDNLTIYCEASSEPDSWEEKWNSHDRPVVWGYKNNKTNEELSLESLKEELIDYDNLKELRKKEISKELCLENLHNDNQLTEDVGEVLENQKESYLISSGKYVLVASIKNKKLTPSWVTSQSITKYNQIRFLSADDAKKFNDKYNLEGNVGKARSSYDLVEINLDPTIKTYINKAWLSKIGPNVLTGAGLKDVKLYSEDNLNDIKELFNIFDSKKTKFDLIKIRILAAKNYSLGIDVRNISELEKNKNKIIDVGEITLVLRYILKNITLKLYINIHNNKDNRLNTIHHVTLFIGQNNINIQGSEEEIKNETTSIANISTIIQIADFLLEEIRKDVDYRDHTQELKELGIKSLDYIGGSDSHWITFKFKDFYFEIDFEANTWKIESYSGSNYELKLWKTSSKEYHITCPLGSTDDLCGNNGLRYKEKKIEDELNKEIKNSNLNLIEFLNRISVYWEKEDNNINKNKIYEGINKYVYDIGQNLADLMEVNLKWLGK